MPVSSLFPLLQKTLKTYRQLLSLQWVREKTHWKLNYLPRTINVFTVPPPKCRGPRECRLWRLHRKHKIYWLWNLQRGKIKWKRFQPGKIIASLHALCPCEVAVVVCRACHRPDTRLDHKGKVSCRCWLNFRCSFVWCKVLIMFC